MAKTPRILLYSHDTYGLGHLRRSLTISHQLAREIKGAYQLLITGSMVAGAYSLPPRLDMVKLPALSKRSNGAYHARTLPLTLRGTIAWREQMILQAAINFKPDIFLVDKSPAGVHGELLPALRYLKAWSPQTQIVLGMRDIEDSPTKTRAEWAADGVPQLLTDIYDHILLYGRRELFDPITAYCLPPAVGQRLTECGYLGRRDILHDVATVRRELGIGNQPLVVVTVGGGGDGYEIQKTAVDLLRQQNARTDYHTLLVTGPLMARRKRQLLQQAAGAPGLTLMEFTPHLMDYLAAADLVISMAGYNTVCEILTLGKRALLIPRMNVRAEQHMRARLLSERGLVHMLLPNELSPPRLATEIEQALAAPAPQVELPLDGLQTAARTIRYLLENPRSAPSRHATNQQNLAEEMIVA